MTIGKSNIVLIGMPGSGKSTVGVILAKMTSKSFIDTDVLIQTTEKKTLQNIVDSFGHMVLRSIEEKVLLSVRCTDHIIATGGSAAYSRKAMVHLQENGIIVYLHTELDVLCKRIRNFETRGLAKRPDQTFADLFNERFALYSLYADITIRTDCLTQEEVCQRIIDNFSSRVEKTCR